MYNVCLVKEDDVFLVSYEYQKTVNQWEGKIESFCEEDFADSYARYLLSSNRYRNIKLWVRTLDKRY